MVLINNANQSVLFQIMNTHMEWDLPYNLEIIQVASCCII
jgi:hypothetical protein